MTKTINTVSTVSVPDGSTLRCPLRWHNDLAAFKDIFLAGKTISPIHGHRTANVLRLWDNASAPRQEGFVRSLLIPRFFLADIVEALNVLPHGRALDLVHLHADELVGSLCISLTVTDDKPAHMLTCLGASGVYRVASLLLAHVPYALANVARLHSILAAIEPLCQEREAMYAEAWKLVNGDDDQSANEPLQIGQSLAHLAPPAPPPPPLLHPLAIPTPETPRRMFPLV